MKVLAPVVQKLMDSAVHRINHYPVDKYKGNLLCYPVDRDLSGGYSFIHLLTNWGLKFTLVGQKHFVLFEHFIVKFPWKITFVCSEKMKMKTVLLEK